MESESNVQSKFLLNRFHLRSLESLLPLGGTCSSNPFYAVKGFCGRTVFCEKKFITLYFSQKRKNCGRIACFRRKTFLCLCTVLLYRLTGKLINYYRKPSKLRIVQWRATPSGSFREPVDYKGQEPSNLVFLGVSSFSSVQQNFFQIDKGLAIGKSFVYFCCSY